MNLIAHSCVECQVSDLMCSYHNLSFLMGWKACASLLTYRALLRALIKLQHTIYN